MYIYIYIDIVSTYDSLDMNHLNWCGTSSINCIDLMWFDVFLFFQDVASTCKIPCGCPGKGPLSGPGPMTFPYNYRTRSGLSHNLLTFQKVVWRLQHRVNDSKNPWTWIGWCVMLLNMIMLDSQRPHVWPCDQAEDYGMLVFVKLLVWQHLAEACGCLSCIWFSQVSRNERFEFRRFGLSCQGYCGGLQLKLRLTKINR